MKKYFLITFLLSVSTITYCQTLRLDSNGFFIDSRQITCVQDVVNSLGLPERTSTKINKIWTYDSLGLRVYLDPASSQLKQVSLDFRKYDFNFSPKKLFSGKLLILKHNIDENTPLTDLKEIKELNFKENAVIRSYSGTISTLKLYFEYTGDVNKLEAVHISF